MTLELKLSALGFSCWLDQNAASITKQAMREGVAASRVLLLFLSKGVLTRPFCIFEIHSAMGLDKPIMLMHETDPRHGAFDFAEADGAPPEIAELLEMHESLPWRRRRFEQDAILTELIKLSGLGFAGRAGAGDGAATAAAAVGAAAAAGPATYANSVDPGSQLCSVPGTVPQLPESFSARPVEFGLVLDVLLDRTDQGAGKTKVLAHGMGGLGKTTLASAVVRNEAARKHYRRIGFVSVGQEPAALEEQRTLHYQLAKTQLDAKPGATVQSQRELLQAAATGQRWLVVLDDVWKPEHEQQLNFLDPAGSPECKVFVTTRFAKLLPGYVEVALGLLDEGAAVELLLGAAELAAGSSTAEQRAAAAKISKLAGFLPLYITLVGRLIYEFGADQPWHTEVVEMLQEDRSSVFGGDGGDALGMMIVGSSLSQVQDSEAQALFSMLAVAAEDVPVPMGALELIWCASRGLSPPLGRIGMMKLRRRVFQLLDRSLVLGETTAGVYMHDVVRDFCIASVPPDELRQHQRDLIALLLSETPAGGWVSVSTESLSVYVHQSLRHHLSDAIRTGADVDDEVLAWLDNGSLAPTHDFWVRSVATACGGNALVRRADTLVAGGGPRFTAGLYYCLSTIQMSDDAQISFLTGENTRVAGTKQAMVERQRRGEELMSQECDSARRRTIAVYALADLLTVLPATEHGGVFSRQGELIAAGVLEPTSYADRVECCIAFWNVAAFKAGCGTLKQGWVEGRGLGSHLNAAAVRDAVRIFARQVTLGIVAMDSLDASDPRQVALWGGAVLGTLGSYGGSYIDSTSDPDGFDVADLCSVARLDSVYGRYSFHPHNQLASSMNPWTIDMAWVYSPGGALVLRHGELARFRAVGELYLSFFSMPGGLECDADFNPINAPAFPMYTYGGLLFCPVMVLAGLGGYFLRWLDMVCPERSLSSISNRYGPTFIDPIAESMTMAVKGPVHFSLFGKAWFYSTLKLRLAYCDPDAVGGPDLDGLLRSGPAGGLCCESDGSYDTTENFCWALAGGSMEAELRERAGQPGRAVQTCAVFQERYPHNAPLVSRLRLVALRCQVGSGGVDGARAGYEAAAAAAHRHRAHLLEALTVRDLITYVCDAGGAGAPARDEVLPLLGRAVRAMSGERTELTAMLGAGLDAAAAEALVS